jgi:sulfatase modifying factor 1
VTRAGLLALLAPVLAACTTASIPPPSAPPPSPAPAPAPPPAVTTRSAEPAVVTSVVETAKPAPESVLVCPEGMALLHRMQGAYCIDRYEASVVHVKSDGSTEPHAFNKNIDGQEKEMRAASMKGVRPQGYISGKQAAMVCENAGKRLCEVDEWVLACRGPNHTRYPYGDVRKPNVCNDRFKVLDHHPVPILWKKDPLDPTDPKLMWHPRFMNDPRLLEIPNTTMPTGARSQCTNDYGVYDMVGNQHEWVEDPEGTFFGGFFMDTYQNGEGCEYRTKGHPFEYHDYSTGFRCCADPKPEAR